MGGKPKPRGICLPPPSPPKETLTLLFNLRAMSCCKYTWTLFPGKLLQQLKDY